jgi:hypothetical protein
MHGPDMWPELVEAPSTGQGIDRAQGIDRLRADLPLRTARPDAVQDRRTRKSGQAQAVSPWFRSAP